MNLDSLTIPTKYTAPNPSLVWRIDGKTKYNNSASGITVIGGCFIS
jgi:hypothetical protein